MATKEADNGKSWKVLSRGEGGSPLLDEEVLKQPMCPLTDEGVKMWCLCVCVCRYIHTEWNIM